MSKEQKQERDNPEQSRRFEEKARELGADESGKRFAKAFKSILPAKKSPAKKSSRPNR
jgi:hypothetical protein